jgi:hypothetical protein
MLTDLAPLHGALVAHMTATIHNKFYSEVRPVIFP